MSKPLRHKSSIWKYFRIKQDDGKRAICLHCDASVSRGGNATKDFTTTNMWVHLKRYHKKELDNDIKSLLNAKSPKKQAYDDSIPFKKDWSMPDFKRSLQSPSTSTSTLLLGRKTKEVVIPRSQLEPAESMSANQTLITRNCKNQKSAFKRLETSSEEHYYRDGSTIFGELVASKLRKYSEHTKSMVEHRIANILFQADMGKYEPDLLYSSSVYSSTDGYIELPSENNTTDSTIGIDQYLQMKTENCNEDIEAPANSTLPLNNQLDEYVPSSRKRIKPIMELLEPSTVSPVATNQHYNNKKPLHMDFKIETTYEVETD